MSEAQNREESFYHLDSQTPLDWHISSEQISDMDEEQLRRAFIELNEKVTRLYDVEMLRISGQKIGEEVKPSDLEHILHPERIG